MLGPPCAFSRIYYSVSIPFKNNFLAAKQAATVPLAGRAERNPTGWGVQLLRLFTLKKKKKAGRESHSP